MPKPPFDLTPEILAAAQRIERLLGRYEGRQYPRPKPRLRRSHRVRTIHDSLAIEGNTLSLEEVSTVLEGKRVSAPAPEILEIKNANDAYDLAFASLEPGKLDDLLRAHGILMKGLINSPGKWRTGAVGIRHGDAIAHIAPPASRIPALMSALVAFAIDPSVPAPIRAAVFHYEFEFIHPFADGNGRLGRLWHSLILARYHPAFEFLPLESIIRHRQSDYYAALAKSDAIGHSTPFLIFSLEATEAALERLLAESSTDIEPLTQKRRLDLARVEFAERKFSRADYRRLFPQISTSTASRDLKAGVESEALIRSGDKATARYDFA